MQKKFSCFQRHIMTGQMGQSLAVHWPRPLSTVHSESRPKPGPVVQYSRWNANTAVKLHNTKAILASDSIILRLVKAFPTSDFSSHAYPSCDGSVIYGSSTASGRIASKTQNLSSALEMQKNSFLMFSKAYNDRPDGTIPWYPLIKAIEYCAQSLLS